MEKPTEDELTIIELLLIEKMGRYPQDLSHNGFDKLEDLYNKIITREVWNESFKHDKQQRP